jgi:hypothetical protein
MTCPDSLLYGIKQIKKSIIPHCEEHIGYKVALIVRRAEYLRTVNSIIDRRESGIKPERPSGPGAGKYFCITKTAAAIQA